MNGRRLRRRRPEPGPPVPPKLLAYDRRDWDGGDPHGQWKEARRVWCHLHNYDHPGAPEEKPPGPLGDWLAMLLDERYGRLLST